MPYAHEGVTYSMPRGIVAPNVYGPNYFLHFSSHELLVMCFWSIDRILRSFHTSILNMPCLTAATDTRPQLQSAVDNLCSRTQP